MSLRLSYYHLIISYLTDADSGFAFFPIKFDALPAGKVIKANKAYIMAVVGVTPPRIT